MPGSTGITDGGARTAPSSFRDFKERYLVPRAVYASTPAGMVPYLDLVIRRELRRLAILATGPQITNPQRFQPRI